MAISSGPGPVPSRKVYALVNGSASKFWPKVGGPLLPYALPSLPTTWA